VLPYLMDEICAGVEIYFTGRAGAQYLRTSFILCDDYTELTSKLFLVSQDATWSDRTQAGSFKSYPTVLGEVSDKLVGDPRQGRVDELHASMRERRRRRNDFFHSTSLLDLSVTSRMCVQGFCDLLEYGELLFGDEWKRVLSACRNLDTLEILMKLERLSWEDPSITPKVNRVISAWPRNVQRPKKNGTQVAEYPEDIHLRLCVTAGGPELRDALETLLT
jgi:hypothetical protein